MKRRSKTSALDREMNTALKIARTPAEVLAIRREYRDKRRRVLSGQPIEYVPPSPTVSAGAFRLDVRPLVDGLRAFGEIMQAALEAFERLPWIEVEGRSEAHERAREFLIAHLSGEQRQTFKTSKYFIVKNRASGRVWRIRTRTTVYNVDELDLSGRAIATFCGVPGGGYLPPADVWLAQKMLLETDETEFLIRANCSQSRTFEGVTVNGQRGYTVRIANRLEDL